MSLYDSFRSFLTAWQAVRRSTRERAIDFDALMIKYNEKQAYIVDVREPDEFASGHVPDALNLPLSSFRTQQLPQFKGRMTVLVCRTGLRSARAQRTAHRAGRTDVVIYKGGMQEWRSRGGVVS